MSMVKRAFKRVLGVMLLLTALTGCQESDYKELVFVGDSIVAQWDLAESFPNLVTRNLGVKGSGLKYLESLYGRLDGENVVVFSGPNDIAGMDASEIGLYVDEYVDAIYAFGAKKVFLYSALPRNNPGDKQDINQNIRKFNAMVQDKVKSIGNITYINVFDQFLHDGHLNMNLSKDGVHLNDYGYEMLAEALKSKL